MSDIFNVDSHADGPIDSVNSNNLPESSSVCVNEDDLKCSKTTAAEMSLPADCKNDIFTHEASSGDHGNACEARLCDKNADGDEKQSENHGDEMNSQISASRDKSGGTAKGAHEQSDSNMNSRVEIEAEDSDERGNIVTNENEKSDNADSKVDAVEDRDETRLESCSEDSGSDGEYESAEEGEDIHMDAENLRDLEERLTDEDKEERRAAAQALKEEGNSLFKTGTYKTAIRTYSRALRTCPLKFAKDRAIMYANRAACKMKLDETEDAVKDCSKALDLHPEYLKARMRRAELYEKLDKLDEALADFQKVVEQDPSQHTARAACVRLPPVIQERNEKLKEEMMGKLKDLGNMVLRPFGLSTNNFKLNQDPNTGGYSVNFVQNPDGQT